MTHIIFHNGSFKEESTKILSISDRALRGDGVFDTMLIVDGHPKHAKTHFDRLVQHTSKIGLIPGTSIENMLQNLSHLIEKNKATDGAYAANTILTGGPAGRGLTRKETPEPQLMMRLQAIPKENPPINAIIAGSVRRNEGSPLSQIKSINYGDNIIALEEAKKSGANEAIMLNNQEHITCATIGNIFVLKDGKLITPPKHDGVMNGIARTILVRDYEAVEKSLSVKDLDKAEAIFISNSIRGLVQIEELNGKQFKKVSLPIPKDFHL